MLAERNRVIVDFLLLACLTAWSQRLSAAQDPDIFSGAVVSQSEKSITLDVNPCASQKLQTITPYKTMGSPTQESCPNGKKYSRVMVKELPSTPSHASVGEFSGEIISENQDSITLDSNPCGERKPVTVSPYKKGSTVAASCPNGKKYTKVTVEQRTAADKDKRQD